MLIGENCKPMVQNLKIPLIKIYNFEAVAGTEYLQRRHTHLAMAIADKPLNRRWRNGIRGGCVCDRVRISL